MLPPKPLLHAGSRQLTIFLIAVLANELASEDVGSHSFDSGDSTERISGGSNNEPINDALAVTY
jgi:hypothetical protein